jgi:hypothetical protein
MQGGVLTTVALLGVTLTGCGARSGLDAVGKGRELDVRTPTENIDLCTTGSLSRGQDPPWPVRRLLLITVDGLGSVHMLDALAEGRVPGLQALQERGAFTLNARTDVTQPYTLPGHAGMLTGLPVQPVAGRPDIPYHGYTGNFDPASGETLHSAGNPALEYVPSVFDVAHDHGLRTCLFSGKTKFSLFAESYDEDNGAPDTDGCDHGRDKLDVSVISDYDSPALVADVIDAVTADECDFAMIHLADLDREGHTTTWGGPEWQLLLEEVDSWLLAIWQAFENANEAGDWALVVTSDHGGSGTGHFDATDLDTVKIPFYVVAPGVQVGADLYAASRSTRVDPLDTLPSYAEPRQPIRCTDAGNLSLTLLGLPEIPKSFVRGMNVEPFRTSE